MQENDVKKVVFVPHNNFHKIVMVEAICACVILLGIIAMRYFSKNTFKNIKELYEQELLTETTVEEVLGKEGWEK